MSAPEVEEFKSFKLCELDALSDGDVEAFEVDGRKVLAARVGDELYSIDDTCSHANFSLSEGELDEDDLTVECPKHGALFSLETGEALTLPATRPVVRHVAEVRDDGVYVTVKTQQHDAPIDDAAQGEDE